MYYFDKDVLFELESVEAQTYDVLEEGKNLVNEKCFDRPHEDYFNDRMEATEGKLKRIEDIVNKEHQRCYFYSWASADFASCKFFRRLK